ncbi:hypothetical protein QAD02_011981 [Eretmocerus hayati]|uniref:Uncharacterized protein n=1 Tax=Eretmocerus hayati TaxID=131215 RepID=A0ACC2NY24_9HYME|nr:hypothetical protein QAD02_011981 [Eretmocerus hayati]
MKTTRAAGEILADDAAAAGVAKEGEVVGNINGTGREASSSVNVALINAESGNDRIVAAGVVHAASRDAVTMNAIDDAASGYTASRAALSRDVALGVLFSVVSHLIRIHPPVLPTMLCRASAFALYQLGFVASTKNLPMIPGCSIWPTNFVSAART